MSKKSILWKKNSELSDTRDANVLLIGLFDINGKKIIHSFKYRPGYVNHYQEEREILTQNIITEINTKNSRYEDSAMISKQDLVSWCYLDEFLACMV